MLPSSDAAGWAARELWRKCFECPTCRVYTWVFSSPLTTSRTGSGTLTIVLPSPEGRPYLYAAHLQILDLTSGHLVVYSLSGISTVILDVPAIRESKTYFPQVGLNSFLLMSLHTLLPLCALVRFLDPLESIGYTLFCSTRFKKSFAISRIRTLCEK